MHRRQPAGTALIDHTERSRALFDAREQGSALGEAAAPDPEQEDLRKTIVNSVREWRITFDAIPDPVLLVEPDGCIIRLNEAARELAGLPFAEVLRRPVGTVRQAEPWHTIAALLRQGGATGITEVRDEEGRTWDLSLSPVSSPDGQSGFVVVARDLTDLVRLQESLRHSETMSAMGALVAGVAHEVRNPLFGLSSTLTALATRLGPGTEHRPYLEVLQGEVSRLSALMQDLLDYGKPPNLVPELTHPGDLMQAARIACAPLAERSKVAIAITAGSPGEDGLPPLVVDWKRMVQAFRNLLENAIQHSPPGGTVTLRAERQVAGDREAMVFSVEDEGSGFPPGELGRVFEPFFTRRRGGTGLGLSLVQRIVEQHQGEITAANRPTGGAVVTVTLPLARST